MKVPVYEIESACELESKFASYLRKEIGKEDNFRRNLEILKTFVDTEGISKEIYSFFSGHNGLIVVEFPKNKIDFYKKIFNKLILFASKKETEWLTNEDKKIIEEDYENAVKNKPVFSVIFELAVRNLIPEKELNEKRMAKIIAKHINITFQSIRNKFRNNIPAGIFEKLFDKTTILGYPLNNITIDDLEDTIEKYGFTKNLLENIHKSLLSEFSQREENDIIALAENTNLENITDIKNFPFERFLYPSEKVLTKIAHLISIKAKNKEKFLRKTDKELDTMDKKMREKTSKIFDTAMAGLKKVVGEKEKDINNLIQNISDYIQEIQKSFKNHLWYVESYTKRISELEEKVKENKELQEIKSRKLSKYLPPIPLWDIEKIVEEYWHIIPYLDVISSKTKKFILSFTAKAYKKDSGIIDGLRDESKRNFVPDFEKIITEYKKIIREIFQPIYVMESLNEMLTFWPPQIDYNKIHSSTVLMDTAHWISIDLLSKGKFYRFGTKGRVMPNVNFEVFKRIDDIGNIILKKFSSQGTVLVYDIRGSTFMAHRLRNAKKQREILNLFHNEVKEVCKAGNSFPVKEMGDGGIIWYGGRAKELYQRLYKERKEKDKGIARYSMAFEEDFNFGKDMFSAENAVKNAVDMVKSAQNFIEKNYLHYRDWFQGISEKEISHDGMTYALLPPEFKSLFRIGIGIASGEPEKDFYFSPNAYGDPDITGPLVNEATIFSSGKSLESSVIVIDNATLFNLILNTKRFYIGMNMPDKIDEEYINKKLLEILKMRHSERIYLFENYYIQQLGIYYTDVMNKEEAISEEILSKYQLEIDENGNLYTEGRRVKILYVVKEMER